MKKPRQRFSDRQEIIDAIDKQRAKRDEAQNTSNQCDSQAETLVLWFKDHPLESVDEKDTDAVNEWRTKHDRLKSLREASKKAKSASVRAEGQLRRLGDTLAEMDTKPMPILGDECLILFETRAARGTLEKSYAKVGQHVEQLEVKPNGHVFDL